ncbi:mucin binding protein, putative [Babesia ovata]|uniref:Mucin binding protein, putative n=1 Tax=Babesia ovata TaxID=189622 RepID=A0A2H6K6U9_9APIC|nr:mucin binding protein, putative [Babesia ovata]GBE58716.1 mucin binding protein, putative [Babesia ovata]
MRLCQSIELISHIGGVHSLRCIVCGVGQLGEVLLRLRWQVGLVGPEASQSGRRRVDAPVEACICCMPVVDPKGCDTVEPIEKSDPVVPAGLVDPKRPVVPVVDGAPKMLVEGAVMVFVVVGVLPKTLGRLVLVGVVLLPKRPPPVVPVVVEPKSLVVPVVPVAGVVDAPNKFEEPNSPVLVVPVVDGVVVLPKRPLLAPPNAEVVDDPNRPVEVDVPVLLPKSPVDAVVVPAGVVLPNKPALL